MVGKKFWLEAIKPCILAMGVLTFGWTGPAAAFADFMWREVIARCSTTRRKSR